MAFITHDIEREMNRVGKRLQARRDRIQTRLKFREKADEFLRREMDGAMLEEEIDHLQAPDVASRSALRSGCSRSFSNGAPEARCAIAFRNFGVGCVMRYSRKSASRSGNGGSPFRRRDELVAGRAERRDDLLDKRRIVRRIDGHRIAHHHSSSPTRRDRLRDGAYLSASRD